MRKVFTLWKVLVILTVCLRLGQCFVRISLWDCFGWLIFTQFPVQFHKYSLFIEEKASPKHSHRAVWCNTDPVSPATSKLVVPARVLAEKLFELILNPFSLWRPRHLLGVLTIYIGKWKFQLENHGVHATACYDFCDLRQCLFSTLFSLCQLILMVRSSTITNLIVK